MVRRIDNEGATVWTATFGTSQESVGYSITQVTSLSLICTFPADEKKHINSFVHRYPSRIQAIPKCCMWEQGSGSLARCDQQS